MHRRDSTVPPTTKGGPLVEIDIYVLVIRRQTDSVCARLPGPTSVTHSVPIQKDGMRPRLRASRCAQFGDDIALVP